MLKFMVVLYKRLRSRPQNHPATDPNRTPPAWDGIIELYVDNSEAMEAAWDSPLRAESDADLPFLRT